MRTIYPTLYEEALSTAYPFDASVSRSNGQITIEDDVFVDGRLFPTAGRHDVFISAIDVGDEVVITLMDGRGALGEGRFPRNAPPEYVTFHSTDSVYLGLLQGYTVRDVVTDPVKRGLHKLAGWPDGRYEFSASTTRFAATVVVPQPHVGLRAVQLESGAVFFGDVYLVGEKGVQLTNPTAVLSSSSGFGGGRVFDGVIRVDVVGDPLFVRKGCEAEGRVTNQDAIVTGLVFSGYTIRPDSGGGVTLMVGSEDPAADPALRIKAVTNGLEIGFVG